MIWNAFTWPLAQLTTELARRAAKNALTKTREPSALARGALQQMQVWLEMDIGEEGGNNKGPWIELWTGKKEANWCAGIIGSAFKMSARRLDLELPFELSLGAKRLGKNIGKAGSFVKAPLPGDVLVYHRGPRGSWQGHVRMCESYNFDTRRVTYIAGNEGKFPSKVRSRTIDLDRSDLVHIARI